MGRVLITTYVKERKLSVSFPGAGAHGTHHRASPVPPLQPLVLPGGHAGRLELLPDRALLWAVLHLVQAFEGLFILHLSTKVTGDIRTKRNVRRKE